MTYKSYNHIKVFGSFLISKTIISSFTDFLALTNTFSKNFNSLNRSLVALPIQKKRWWAVVVFELTVLSALYCIFYLCSINYSSQKSKQHQSQAFYTSSIFSRPRIETYGYQTRNSSAKRSNGLVSNSTRVLLVYRLMLNISILLLLAQLANDVEIQPGPGQAQSLNGLHIC